MIEEIDLNLFLEIITNEGCLFRWQQEVDGVIVYHYLSKYGSTREQIFGGDESLEREVVEKHLDKLELSDLKSVMPYTKIDFATINSELAKESSEQKETE